MHFQKKRHLTRNLMRIQENDYKSMKTCSESHETLHTCISRKLEKAEQSFNTELRMLMHTISVLNGIVRFDVVTLISTITNY